MADEQTGVIPESTETAAPVTDAVGDDTASQNTSTDEGGAGVESLVGRLKTAGVSANDLEQVERYRGGWESEKELRGQVSEFESDSYRDKLLADSWMRDVEDDAELLAEHQAWRETQGDRAYVEASKRGARELAAERGDEPGDDALVRRLDRLEAREKERLEASDQRRRQDAFDKDLTKIMGGIKGSDTFKEYLYADIVASVPEDIQNEVQLLAHANKRAALLTKLLTSEGKTSPPKTPIKTEPPPASGDDDGDTSDASEWGKQEEMSIKGIVAAACNTASAASGAS